LESDTWAAGLCSFNQSARYQVASGGLLGGAGSRQFHYFNGLAVLLEATEFSEWVLRRLHTHETVGGTANGVGRCSAEIRFPVAAKYLSGRDVHVLSLQGGNSAIGEGRFQIVKHAIG